MIKLLPITALNYELPTDPDKLDVYIDIDDDTAKKLSSPGCDRLTFDDVTGLSSRILHQLVRNHFNDPRQGTEYQWFAIDQTLHKQFTHFMNTLIPEASLIDFQYHDWHQTYIYQGQKKTVSCHSNSIITMLITLQPLHLTFQFKERKHSNADTQIY